MSKNGGSIDPEKTGTRYAAGFIDQSSADKRAGTAGDGRGDSDGAMNNTPVMKKKSSSGALGVAGPDET